MKLSDLMQNRTPKPDFAGEVTADDMVLAVGFTLEPGTHPDDYFVAQQYVTEHSGTLESQTKSNQYIRTGEVSTKTGTKRKITVNGNRYIGDDFQDELLSHDMKYGTGSEVVKPYVYFNMLTGEGETGMASISINNDPSGAAGDNAGFSATLDVIGKPVEYTYAKKPA